MLRHGWRRWEGLAVGASPRGEVERKHGKSGGSERGWRYKREGYSTASGRKEEKRRRSQSIFFSMHPSGHRNPKSEEKPGSG